VPEDIAMAEIAEPQRPDFPQNVEGAASAEADDRPPFSVNDKRFWVARERGEDAENGEERGAKATTVRMPTYLEHLQEQLQEKDRLLRAHVAETRNEQEELRRRLARELEQRVELATGQVLSDFLPVLDNLDRALQSAAQSPNFEALSEGIQLVRAQFLGVLGRYGLKALERQGQAFDPSLDEAVTTIEVGEPQQQNLVLQEWEKGYTLHDKVLRPAKVAVGKLRAEDR
jgi:molecular chaperone GrpE